MGVVEGKVALISGVARGQGRSHAVRLAEEGANIIGFDICENDPSVEYPLANQADLEETIALVEKTGQKIHAVKADVRDFAAVKRVVDDGVAEFGRLDIILANAGIMPVTGEQRLSQAAWHAGIDTMLTGVHNTIYAGVGHIRSGNRGGSIIITSSTAGLVGGLSDGSPGMLSYIASKHGVVGLMRAYAVQLAGESIRVNTVHPTGVASPMILNEAFNNYIQEFPEIAANLRNPMPTREHGMLLPEDVTENIMFLLSDAGRFVTGQTVIFDAGFTAR
ncbi:3-ketoacyl-ACP reductase [Mycolicibacterium fortuitum]|uniref:3-ketoacyl-ACP reductase n=1 Tax=Mycolicibacterium fortuitum TaxID=1766 RepID=A0ABD6QC84_MYCFO|nr:mycofactocin-coupled SDR family oxidoreductase [Mycolicibacterium fortuitum]OMC33131.1 3-ketoacyl-ACP reductase [Mycolicibacterium fortuitum]